MIFMISENCFSSTGNNIKKKYMILEYLNIFNKPLI